jgi:hypothetical protein
MAAFRDFDDGPILGVDVSIAVRVVKIEVCDPTGD